MRNQEEITIQNYNDLLIRKKLEEINRASRHTSITHRQHKPTRAVYNKDMRNISLKSKQSHL